MRFLEWYLRLPNRPESEDVGWSVVLERARPSGAAEWALSAAIVALAILSLASYYRHSRELPRKLRFALLGLRLSSVTLACLLLLGVGLAAQLVGRPKLVLMLDVSGSMSTPDMERIDADSGDDADAPVDRLTAAVDALLQDDARVLHDLARRYRLLIYQFGPDAELVASIDAEEDVADVIPRLQALISSAPATQPAVAVETILREQRGQSLASIVALTDGVSSSGPNDSWTAAIDPLNAAGSPLTAIPIGAVAPAMDAQVLDSYLPESAWIGQPVSFQVEVRFSGAADRQARIELRQAGADQVLDSRIIELENDDVREWVSLSLTPRESGTLEYEARVVALDDEQVLTNNAVTHLLDVRQGRIRVLLVESVPRWEFRHLKAVLERDDLVDLDVVLTWADAEYVLEDAAALPAFPSTREELLGPLEATETSDASVVDTVEPGEVSPELPVDSDAGYDVIIWGDVDPESLVPDALSLLQEFVRVKGGGLILIAGSQYNPWSYFDSPMGPMLPFPTDGVEVSPRPPGVPAFRQLRSLEAQSFGFLRFDNDAEVDGTIWESLPEMHWLLPIERLKPGAQILAEHPNLQGSAGLLPTVIHQRYGAGRVVYLATDEFWQWRAGVEDAYYGRFWSQMVRAVTPMDTGHAEDDRAGLASLQPVYAEGDPVGFRMVFSRDMPFPGNGQAEVVVERDSIMLQRVALAPSVHHPSSLEGTGTPLPPGSYRAWLSEPPIPGELPSCRFEVDAGHRELIETIVNRQELETAAEKTGGSLLELDVLSQLPGRLPPGRRVATSEVIYIPLWSRPEPLLLLTLLLACEWSLRRRHRLT